ncbi:hypothetical protein [Methylobacterium pseudosasicola]|uniref:Uncharacterized protein n=1 Tax=Methylobacterium pseudosasicola TaxID=582667 RepID=A0A1I4NL94_9HYPH|nr:hypothetical protein [Methylobacterium pseudosasicola]SFM16221.1 hypothetical protein SAMN05192568_102149 [Methylobacterium pseudosasicola]
MAIQITRSGTDLLVRTPHANTNFNARIKDMGGRWEAPAWRVDARNEALVRAALVRSYGGDGEGEPDTVSLQCHIEKDSWQSPVEVAGRIIARAFGRDSGAKLGEGIVRLDGSVTSGGSRANWTTVVDATVVIHDCPRKVAAKAMADGYTGVTEARLYVPDVQALAEGVD